MELTFNEQKILDDATKANERNRNEPSKLNLTWLLVGIAGGSILVIDGIIGLVNNRIGALKDTSYGLLLIGLLAVMYENLRFRRVALSVIRKLKNGQK